MSATNEKDKARERSRNNARTFGGIVYVGGTVAATVLFITFVLTAFPKDAYVSRVIMTLAACAVGMSMIAFPIAMHSWVVTKDHRFWGTILYYGEMLIITVNTVVAFVSLLSKYAGYAAPEWAMLYEPFSVASIIYTVFAWGTVFLLDPQHQEFADDQENERAKQRDIAALKQEFRNTQEGKKLIAEMAKAEIAAEWTVENHLKHKGLLTEDGLMPVGGTPFEKKSAVSPSPLPEMDDEKK
jgi:hypothetical protein